MLSAWDAAVALSLGTAARGGLLLCVLLITAPQNSSCQVYKYCIFMKQWAHTFCAFLWIRPASLRTARAELHVPQSTDFLVPLGKGHHLFRGTNSWGIMMYKPSSGLFCSLGEKNPTNFKDYLSTPKHERLGCLTQSSGSTALTKRVLIWRLLKAVGLVVWSGWCWLCWLFVWLFSGAYVRVTGSSVEIRSWGITPVLFLWLNHVFQQFPYCIGINASLLCISMCSDTP